MWWQGRWVLASHNPGKAAEFGRLLAPWGIEVEALWAGTAPVAAETGHSYEENALIKARAVAARTGRPALADDSGLEVDALGGAPGIHTADWVSDDPWVNTRTLLCRLMEVPAAARTARMRAVVALVGPAGEVAVGEGVVEGWVVGWPRGNQGFGVDPIFSPDGRHTFGEMAGEAKDRISHRRRALDSLLAKLGLPGAR
jgi:XTP/dITP diphosphohydrolase